MFHEPSTQSGRDAASAYKTRVGLILFLIYGVVYISFVIVNTFSPGSMGQIVMAGLNLAVVYGFGLIILAIVMGLVYNVMCSRAEDRLNSSEDD